MKIIIIINCHDKVMIIMFIVIIMRFHVPIINTIITKISIPRLNNGSGHLASVRDAEEEKQMGELVTARSVIFIGHR